MTTSQEEPVSQDLTSQKPTPAETTPQNMTSQAMTSQNTTPPEITILPANPTHLPSLSTLVPRAFHPTNAFHRLVFPNTPANRTWWTTAFSAEISSPTTHILTATTPNTPHHALAILCLRLLAPSEPTRGFWHLYPLSPDHDATLYVPAMEAMTLLPGEGTERYLLELFGVDHGWKGMGIGRRMLERACGIADAKAVPIYVEANMLAVGFYGKFGFVEAGVPVGLEGLEYVLHLLVRWPVGRERA